MMSLCMSTTLQSAMLGQSRELLLSRPGIACGARRPVAVCAQQQEVTF
jgi:hypothetical protein